MLYELGKAGKALLYNFKRWGGVLVPKKQFWFKIRYLTLNQMRHDHLHRFEIVQVTFLKKAAGVSDLTRASSGYKDDNDCNYYDCLQTRSLEINLT